MYNAIDVSNKDISECLILDMHKHCLWQPPERSVVAVPKDGGKNSRVLRWLITWHCWMFLWMTWGIRTWNMRLCICTACECPKIWLVATCAAIPAVPLNNSSVNTSCLVSLFPFVVQSLVGCPVLSAGGRGGFGKWAPYTFLQRRQIVSDANSIKQLPLLMMLINWPAWSGCKHAEGHTLQTHTSHSYL